MLNDIKIRKLAAPERGVKQYPDGKLAGFGVRVTANGVKSFYLTYRIDGKSRRINLGRYPVITLAKARSKAHTALVELSEGRDPRGDEEKQTPVETFAAAVDQFVTTHCLRNNRASTAAETARLLNVHFVSAWRNSTTAQINRTHINTVLEPLLAADKPSAARHAFAAIRKFFNWAVEQGLIDDSPCRTMKAPGRIVSRDRVLTDDELVCIWRKTEEQGDTFGIIVRLLMLTAQRRGEIGNMAWDELDFENRLWLMPGSRTKNHKSHSVPLSDTVLTILQSIPRKDSPFVFPARGKPDQPYSGYSKGKRALNAAVELQDWTLHDLRRTAATGMAQLGVEPHIVECVLNHSSGTFGGVTGIYNRYRYVDAMRDALNIWEKQVLKILR